MNCKNKTNIALILTYSLNTAYIIIKYFYHLFKRIIRKIIFLFELIRSKNEPIIRFEKSGDHVIDFKSESIERVFYAKTYNLSKESWVDFFSPKIEVRKFSNTLVYSESDFIVTKDGAIWEKYFKQQWTKIVPLDKALLRIRNNHIFIRKARHTKNIDVGFSLCGVHSTIWAHFIVQYLPKLYLIDKIRSVAEHKDLTVIIPPYKDAQVREIVYNYLSLLKNINIVELKLNNVAVCKVLYHIENTSHISDHANYINPSDILIPKFTIDILKANLVCQLLDNKTSYLNENLLPFRKLYIGRTGVRNMINNEEIEQYFVNQGFEIIYPHRISLNEKAKIFREAAIIVGPGSSGFTNIIFCKPGAKALAFINFQRVYDGYCGTLGNYFGVDLMFVTGNDQSDSIHSSYHIPLDKIKSAFLELIS